jgi:TetR/AcrR family transcriptional repressor of nem operon
VVRGNWTPQSLAHHIQAVIQGGFILAKASGSAGVAAESFDRLRRYLELVFGAQVKHRPIATMRRLPWQEGERHAA